MKVKLAAIDELADVPRGEARGRDRRYPAPLGEGKTTTVRPGQGFRHPASGSR